MSNCATLTVLALLALTARVNAQDAAPHDHTAHDHAGHGDQTEHAEQEIAAPAPAAHEHEREHEHASSYAPPVVDPAERAAAFPDLGAMRMADMMQSNPRTALVRLDRLEAQNADGDDVLSWELNAEIGSDLRKLAIRSEGEKLGGTTERAQLELLWDRGVSRWWDIVAGVRGDFAPGETRSWAAFGVQGMTPYRWSLAATLYAAEGGRAAARVETYSEVLVTNRLILEPRIEANWFAESDAARRRGSGLADVELGLRLRYEIRRQIAPYVGLERAVRRGKTADVARLAGDDTGDTRLVAGIRFWF